MLVLTKRSDESLLIGDDIKITVSNICKNRINLCVNDSLCVIVNLQESISIRDGIIVKVVKTDKAQVKLGIEAPEDVTFNWEEVYREDHMILQ